MQDNYATDTPSERVILTAFLRQNLLRERPSVLHLRALLVLLLSWYITVRAAREGGLLHKTEVCVKSCHMRPRSPGLPILPTLSQINDLYVNSSFFSIYFNIIIQSKARSIK
jgi:hypothetical protein